MEITQPIKYCLYARKSGEAEEKQALSIDSQVKEMLTIAQRDNLNIIDMYRESHSAKDAGQRPVYNKLLLDIKEENSTGYLYGIPIAWLETPETLGRSSICWIRRSWWKYELTVKDSLITRTRSFF